MHRRRMLTAAPVVLGPLALVAILYEILGIIIAWIVKQIFWVPHRFRHGILVAGGWGNVGDLREPISSLHLFTLSSLLIV